MNPSEKLEKKLQSKEELSFKIPIKPSLLECVEENNINEYKMQLQLTLFKPENKEIYSNIETFRKER